jgi:hypothetical protein
VATLVATGNASAAQARRTPARQVSSQLTSVRLRSTEQSIQVIFVTTGAVRYKATRTVQPSRITIDLLQTGISPVFTKRELLSVHPALIRVLITRPAGTTRAVLDLAAAGTHAVSAAEDRLVVEIKVRAKASAAPATPAPLDARALPPIGTDTPDAVLRQVGVGPPLLSNAVKIPWVPLSPRIEDFTSANPPIAAARVDSFRQREPGEGRPITEETTAYLAYDSDHLYAVFVCRDGSSEVRGSLSPRDSITEDDHVAVYLDTFRDGRHGYVFASNPYGVQQDGLISEGDEVSYLQDMVWQSRGRRTADGFIVWMAIPFKSLRFPAASRQSWRIALGRTIARRSESAYWPFITRGAAAFVDQMAELDGLELISPGRNIQLAPYGTFAREQTFGSGSPAGDSLSEVRRGGLDAKVVVRNAVAIDLAVNPDFSEVESDDPLVMVNQRFEPFRPEKRPFFMENSGVFETPISVLFSRRIVDPDVGLRLTARSRGWAIGGLAANDRATAAEKSAPLLGPGARLGAARVQRSLGERSHIGVLATDRAVNDSRNRVVSVDGRVQVTPAWGLSAQTVRSDDVQPGAQRQIGRAHAAAISRLGSHFTYVGAYRDVDSRFRVPLGYVPRVDIRMTDQYAGYLWQVGTWSIGPSVNAVAVWDHAGQLQDRWTSGEIGVSQAGYLDARASHADALERYGADAFHTRTSNVSFSGRPSEWLYVWGLYQWGTAINYTPPAGVAPFVGLRRGVYASISVRASARIDLEQIVLREQLDTPAGADTVFRTGILRSQANLRLTKALSVRGVVDFSELASDQSLFAEPGRSGLAYDVLVRFLPHPGTAFFVGFNKRFEDLAADPRSPADPFLRTIPGMPVGRRLFAKVSYLFRL